MTWTGVVMPGADLTPARLEQLLAFAALRAATNEGDPNEQ